MKIQSIVRRLACVALLIQVPLAFDQARGQEKGTTTGVSHATVDSPAPPPPSLGRFNLEFAGGPIDKFIETVSRAAGRPINVILNPDLADAKIPPMKLRDVTLPTLFEAVGAASRQRWPNPATGAPGKYEHGFRTGDSPPNPDSVWVFFREGEPPPNERKASEKESVVEVINVTKQLEGRSIEDITTAIHTACSQTDLEQGPKLTFHKETNLLITKSHPEHVRLIHRVLDELVGNSPAAHGAEEAAAPGPASPPPMSPELMRRYGLVPAPATAPVPRRPSPARNPAPE